MPRGRLISPEVRERIAGLAATGLGFKAIAAECGVATATVQRVASKAGQRRRATKTIIARAARPDAMPRAKRPSYEVLVDAYLAAVEAERLAVNGDRAAARGRTLAALDRAMGRAGM